MKKLLFLPVLLLFCFPFSSAEAANTSANFSASAPTLYVDGTTIGVDDTLSYFMYCGTSPGVYNIALNVTTDLVNGGEDVSVALCVPTPGTYYFVVTAYSFLYQSESSYSNEVSKVFIAADFDHIPMAPTILVISP